MLNKHRSLSVIIPRSLYITNISRKVAFFCQVIKQLGNKRQAFSKSIVILWNCRQSYSTKSSV